MKIYIAVVGLGYAGLPLAIEFGKKFNTFGYDINSKRILELKKGIDRNLQSTKKEINKSTKLQFTMNISDIKKCNFYIISIPTPITKNKKPDFKLLKSVSRAIGKIINNGDFIVYESTVYPGATKEICIPILEKYSNLQCVFSDAKNNSNNSGFFVGYSPERINPGDKKHTLKKIIKITSGSNKYSSNFINKIYSKIIDAGTYNVQSIEVAEAAKVIENIQRDVNIALINELSMIFKKLNIKTTDVLKAASTKWNFLNFAPGLVGGHCIGIDPYYLIKKAYDIGHTPKIISAGRKINDEMTKFIFKNFISLMIAKKIEIKESKVLIMGLTFKENCPDYRNSKVIDLINFMIKKEINVHVYDPFIPSIKGIFKNKVKVISNLKEKNYDGVIISVAHDQFRKIGIEKIKKITKNISVIYDLKSIFVSKQVDDSL